MGYKTFCRKYNGTKGRDAEKRDVAGHPNPFTKIIRISNGDRSRNFERFITKSLCVSRTFK